MRAIQFQAKRVGSTFLQKAIDSHPEIMGIDEVFVNMAKIPGMRKSGFVPFLRSDFSSKPKDYIEEVINAYNKNTIFKLMYNQIEFHPGLLGYILDKKIPMIHLMRKNLVKQVISGQTAASEDHVPIKITGQELMNAVKEAHRLQRYWVIKFKDQIKLTLVYEDLFGEVDGERTFLSNNSNVAVCDFFNVPQCRLFAETKKKNKDDLSVYLPNLDDIKKVFAPTKFKWMLT